MKQRNVMTVVLLSIITLGIYDLYWLVQTKKVLNKETDIHTPSIWLLFAPFLLLLGIMFLPLVLAASGNGRAQVAGLVVTLIDIVLLLVIVPITFYWFFKFSKAVNHYTKGEMNTAMAFILLWMLRFIGIAVIQDKFNDMQSGVATAGTAMAPQAAFAAATSPVQPQPPVSSSQFEAPSAPAAPLQEQLAQPVAPAAPAQPVVAPVAPAPEITNESTVSAEKTPEDNSAASPSTPPSTPIVG